MISTTVILQLDCRMDILWISQVDWGILKYKEKKKS